MQMAELEGRRSQSHRAMLLGPLATALTFLNPMFWLRDLRRTKSAIMVISLAGNLFWIMPSAAGVKDLSQFAARRLRIPGERGDGTK